MDDINRQMKRRNLREQERQRQLAEQYAARPAESWADYFSPERGHIQVTRAELLAVMNRITTSVRAEVSALLLDHQQKIDQQMAEFAAKQAAGAESEPRSGLLLPPRLVEGV